MINKKFFLTAALPVLLAACGGGGNPTLPILTVRAYAVTSDTLYNIYLEGIGTDQKIGPVNASSSVTDLAWNGQTLYAVTGSRLLTLNTVTGSATDVGSLGVSDMNALTFDAQGHLYAASGSGTLYTVNTGTGLATRVGSLGSPVSGDLAFAPDGTLYATLVGATSDLLAKVNVSTGAATPLGPTGFSNVYGLDYAADHLYGLTGSGQVISLDLQTGAGRLLHAASLPFVGGQSVRSGAR